jgi:maltooligosyltrehalose synthase
LRTEGESAGHVVAFAREELSGGALAVVIVPRLTVSLCDESHSPVGHEVWRSTRVVLPIHAQTHTWRCALTGRAVVSDGERKAIMLGDAFGALPGTVLMPAA